MIAREEFEYLRFDECCPDGDPLGDLDDPTYDWEYQGGLYETLEIFESCLVQFGYGEKTGKRLVYILCESAGGKSANLSDVTRTLERIGFPFLIGQPFPDKAALRSCFSDVKVRQNPHTSSVEAKAYADYLHVWMGADHDGDTNMIYLHNVDLIRQNDLDGAIEYLHQFV